MQEKPVPKSGDEGCQRKAGEECADGKQGCPKDIRHQPHQACAQRPQQDARKNDGDKGKANLQIPEIDGKETGQNNLHRYEHCHQHQAMCHALLFFGHKKIPPFFNGK